MENSLEGLNDAVANAIACFCFGIGFAAQTVVSVAIETLSALANVILSVVDDFKPQLSF